ncbi:tellurite resistance TerB family protein [Sorangium sp. So ce1036]|uniref:tellurite resistance TerB family protein n=1 Tax=Sorangium sp. So ce1036 TaxID=3133328 RepID=UPI003F0A04DB
MKPPALVQQAAGLLRARFDLNEYNPTPIVDLGALVANADGNVDAEELDALRQLIEPMLGAELNAELVRYLIEASLKVIAAAGVEPRVRLLAEILMDCDAVEEGIIVALAVAHASEGLSAPERAVIESLARAARLPPGRLDRLSDDVRAAFAT